MDKIRILPNVDIDVITDYKKVVDKCFNFTDGIDESDYMYVDKMEIKNRDRNRVLSLFKKFSEEEGYNQFRTVFKRMNFFSYYNVVTVLYWYCYFLYKRGVIDEEPLIKGFQLLEGIVVRDTEEDKIYDIHDIDYLRGLYDSGDLKYMVTDYTFEKEKVGDREVSRLRSKVIEDNRYDIEYIEYMIMYDNVGELIGNLETDYLRDFLKSINEVSNKDKEILIVFIYTLKILKKGVANGYGMDNYLVVKRINKGMDILRDSLTSNKEWVDDIIEKDIIGWED